MICKVVLLVTLAALVGFVKGADPPQPQYRDLFLPVMDECKECVGATEEDVEIGLNRGDLSTPTLECLQYCMYHKIGVLDGVVLNETVTYDAYITVHGGTRYHAENVVDQCYREAQENSENDACNFAANLERCFINAQTPY